MSYIQLPLLKKNNQIFFDVSKIKEHDFIKKSLNIKTNDFVFETFGFCKDKKFFYIVINLIDGSREIPETFEFSLNEINGRFFISDVVKKDIEEDLFCALLDIN